MEKISTVVGIVQQLVVRHVLDAMHCEKNICALLLNWLIGEKDSAAMRMDLQERGIRPQLWLRQFQNNRDRLWQLDAPYVLSPADRRVFLNTLKSVKFPSGYVSNLYNQISDAKLRGLKSHDFHVMIQQVLPVCLRNVGDPRVVNTIMRLSRVFQRLCAKVISKNSKDQLLQDVAKTLARLERDFPPAFFDIMVHLIEHLAEEVFICGPAHMHWMYPFEATSKHSRGTSRIWHVRKEALPKGIKLTKLWDLPLSTWQTTLQLKVVCGMAMKMRP
jgi:hypothetical protein